jgi:hypothetical protein
MIVIEWYMFLVNLKYLNGRGNVSYSNLFFYRDSNDGRGGDWGWKVVKKDWEIKKCNWVYFE